MADEIIFSTTVGATVCHVYSPELIKEIIERKGEFVKPIHIYRILDVFGKNVVTLNDSDWKRHRRVTGPHFSERNNELVFKETIRTTEELVKVWEAEGLEKMKDFSNASFNVALHVISSAAFGVPLSLNDEKGFKKVLVEMIESLFPYVSSPRFLFHLGIPYFHKLEGKIRAFEESMKQLINTAKEGKSEYQNLLTSLISSTSEDGGEAKITSDELLGNMFIFLLAGHETTAGNLAFAFGLLALHPTAQERLYDEIKAVIGNGEFQYQMLNSMPFTLAIMYETLRMYPPVESIPKYTLAETTTLGKYIIPKDCLVDIHAFGAHFHPSWGEDRFVFNPKRWFNDPVCADSASATLSDSASLKGFLKSYRYAFIPFSDGPRACLGKRFAEIEFMTCLVRVVREYSLSPTPGSGDEILEGERGITFKTKNPVQLILKKRI